MVSWRNASGGTSSSTRTTPGRSTDDSSALYNLGCFHAIGGDIERAFDCLFRAVDCGFAHREWMENDADLGSRIRTDPRWEQLLARFG